MRMRRTAVFLFLLSVGAAGQASTRLVTDEAEAVLAILEKRSRGELPAAGDWTRLFATEGHRISARCGAG